ncbi:hypothetical protein K0U83_23810 [bacterium]|nr:hypothetical protein [bacterium]
MRSHLSTAVELAGYGVAVSGVWVLFGHGYGLLALGASLVVVAYGLGGKR